MSPTRRLLLARLIQAVLLGTLASFFLFAAREGLWRVSDFRVNGNESAASRLLVLGIGATLVPVLAVGGLLLARIFGREMRPLLILIYAFLIADLMLMFLAFGFNF